MSPTIAIAVFVIGLVALVIGIVLGKQGNDARVVFEDAKKDLDDEREELAKERASASSSSKKKSTKKKSEPESKKEATLAPAAAAPSSEVEDELRQQVSDIKSKLDKQRQKNHDITRERDDLRTELEKAKNPSKGAIDQVALVDLRMELSEAKAEVEQYKLKVAELEKGGKKGKKKVEEPAPEPVEVKKEEPKERAPAAEGDAADAVDVDAIHDDYRAKLKRTEDKARKEEGELRDKLRKLGREADNHRRRADNNDKAYRITQRELDAAREHIRLLNEQLKRARFASSSAAAQAPGDDAPAEAPEEEVTQVAPDTDATVEVDPTDMEAAAAESEVTADAEESSEDVEATEQVDADAADNADAPAEAEEEVAEEPVAEEAEEVAEEPAAEEEEVAEAAPEDAAEEEAAEEVAETSDASEEADAEPAEDDEEEEQKIADTGAAGGGLEETSFVDEAWADIDFDDDV